MNPMHKITVFLVALSSCVACSATSVDPDIASWRVAQADARPDARPKPIPEPAGDDIDDRLALKIAAVEALMNAPAERAMPLLERIINGNQDERLKSRALFVLSQTDHPDAQRVLVNIARSGPEALRRDAIRSIGIGGQMDALRALRDVYAEGDRDTRKSVLRAYLIASEPSLVYELARDARDDEEFEDAVRVLASMGATRELRQLKDRAPTSDSLIRAYSVAGDIDSLNEIARSDASPEIRQRAIRGIGVNGGPEAGRMLAALYRDSNDEMVRSAVLDGLMVAGDDKALLELFRASTDDREKRRMLRMLVNMDSDAAIELIDSTLSEQD